MRFLILFSILLTFSQVTLGGFTDYSKKGGEYEILKDIRLNVDKVNFVEKRKVKVLDEDLDSSVFEVKAYTTIQTVESYSGIGSVFEDLETEYELIISKDSEYKVHDKLIEKIHKILMDDPKDNFVFSKINLTYRNGKYLIVEGEYAVPNFIWFDGRIVQIKFKRFSDKKKNGLGAEQGFWEKKIRFYVNDRKFPIEFMMNKFQNEFLQLYKDGKFKRP
jgi:hypothetical protein